MRRIVAQGNELRLRPPLETLAFLYLKGAGLVVDKSESSKEPEAKTSKFANPDLTEDEE